MLRNNVATRMERNVSTLPIEVVHTHLDVNPHLQHDENTGYTFDYPSSWLSAFSNKKSIAVRKLQLFSSSHHFEMGYMKYYTEKEPTFNTKNWVEASAFHYRSRPLIWREGEFITEPIFTDEYPANRDKTNWHSTPFEDGLYTYNVVDEFMYLVKYVCSIDPTNRERPHLIITYVKESDSKIEIHAYKTTSKLFHVIDENDTAEVLYNILENDMNAKLSLANYPIRIKYEYNAPLGSLRIRTWVEGVTGLIYEVTQYPKFHFDFGGIKITSSHPFHSVDAIEFLKFLNQEITLENYFKIQVPSRAIEFKKNIWNRKQAMFHASFSNCGRNYLGLRNDFYNPPSKYFNYTGGSDFNLKFSTDGTHWFIPRHIGFLIELAYILNVEEVEVVR